MNSKKFNLVPTGSPPNTPGSFADRLRNRLQAQGGVDPLDQAKPVPSLEKLQMDQAVSELSNLEGDVWADAVLQKAEEMKPGDLHFVFRLAARSIVDKTFSLPKEEKEEVQMSYIELITQDSNSIKSLLSRVRIYENFQVQQVINDGRNKLEQVDQTAKLARDAMDGAFAEIVTASLPPSPTHLQLSERGKK